MADSGTLDPLPRCRGDCCRGFSLEHPLAKVQADLALWKENPSAPGLIPDVAAIMDMLIPLGVFRGQELFTCRHLGASGDCTVYQTRPQMCRTFPGPNPCPYRNCASHGPQPAWKRALNWLRD